LFVDDFAIFALKKLISGKMVNRLIG